MKEFGVILNMFMEEVQYVLEVRNLFIKLILKDKFYKNYIKTLIFIILSIFSDTIDLYAPNPLISDYTKHGKSSKTKWIKK